MGIITGGAGNMIGAAHAAGLDTFITGEGAHYTYFDAIEWGLNVIFAGPLRHRDAGRAGAGFAPRRAVRAGVGVPRPPDRPVTAPPALALRGIRKRFGSVQALRGADFALMPGELHALLGENGAGKTTLMQVAYGLVRPDAGEVAVDGVVRARSRSPRAARRLGIGMVHQHFTSVPALTVAENVALAAGWPVRPAAAARSGCARSPSGSGLPLEPDAPAGDCRSALKQRLEIVKALAADARILLLDEPTAVLAPAEADDLLRVVRRVHRARRRGGAHHPQARRGAGGGGLGDGAAAGMVVLDGPVAGAEPRDAGRGDGGRRC